MTDIDFHSFRADVPAPDPGVREAARSRLTAAMGQPARLRLASPRRLATVLATGVALVAAAFVALSVVDGGAGVLERAEAAIDPQGRILHVVVRIESNGSVSRGESWIRPNGTGRSVELAGGSTADCIGSEAQLRCFDAARNVVDVYRYFPDVVEARRRDVDLPGFRVDQPKSIHRAFADGYARLVGETEVDGHAVYEVELATPFIDAKGRATPRFDLVPSPMLYLDRETYHPVAQHFPDSGSITFYETYEFLASEPATRRLLQLPTNSETEVIVHPVGEGPQS